MSDKPTLTDAYQQGRDDERNDWEGRHHEHSIEVPPDMIIAKLIAENSRRQQYAESVQSVLLDLIAELRAQHYADQCDCGCEQWYECKPCSHVGLCPSQEAAVRAEARLREVSPEFPEGATVADVSMSLSKGHDDE